MSRQREYIYFIFCVVFSSTFETVDRKALLFKLSCISVSTKLVLVALKACNSSTNARMWCREGVTVLIPKGGSQTRLNIESTAALFIYE